MYKNTKKNINVVRDLVLEVSYRESYDPKNTYQIVSQISAFLQWHFEFLDT